MTELHTERLLLRPLNERDIDAMVAYRSQVDVCRYVPFTPMSHADVAERIAGQWARTELTDEGQAVTLGIEVVESGRLVGDVMLAWHSRLHGGGELGYVLNPDFGGQGYATEAARELVRFGFEVVGLHRIVARVDERNASSARVCHRLGMRLEARLVQNEFFKGEWTNELDFAVLADEWMTGSS